jgi:hypothetical protein
MEITIRRPNLEALTKDKIPRDFYEVMAYFNHALSVPVLERTDHWRYMPRQRPITKDEIRDLWVPSFNTNITFLAELPKRGIIGSASVIVSKDSTAYEHRDSRGPNTLAMSVAQGYSYSEICEKMIRLIEADLTLINIQAITTTPVEFKEEIRLMEETLRKKGEPLSDWQPAKQIGLSGKALTYTISS